MNPNPLGDVALALRGTAPRRSPTVRVLAAYSGHTDCNVAALAFAASVDMDQLLVGTPFQAQVGGETAFFEADALAARFAGPIHGGEVKSFPVVDGRAEPDKLGAALDQISIYILLTQQLVAELGGDPDLAVSMTAMLIAPRN